MAGEVVKVTLNYQVTIPATVGEKAGIRVGDLVEVSYEEREGAIKNSPAEA